MMLQYEVNMTRLLQGHSVSMYVMYSIHILPTISQDVKAILRITPSHHSSSWCTLLPSLFLLPLHLATTATHSLTLPISPPYTTPTHSTTTAECKGLSKNLSFYCRTTHIIKRISIVTPH